MTPPGSAAPNPELLRSLALLVRGLSSLFWGLPFALLLCFHTARSEGFYSLGGLPPVVTCAWLLYGLWELSSFQKQERIWRTALERAGIMGIINLSLSPFLYWHSRVPDNEFFWWMSCFMGLGALAFLASLNLVLRRLGAMLPDETLRFETRQFTILNINLLAAMALLCLLFLAGRSTGIKFDAPWLYYAGMLLERFGIFLVVPLVLLPVAMTMAMLWKTKQVILDSIFSGKT